MQQPLDPLDRLRKGAELRGEAAELMKRQLGGLRRREGHRRARERRRRRRRGVEALNAFEGSEDAEFRGLKLEKIWRFRAGVKIRGDGEER